MPEKLKQKISQFLDDELDHGQALALLKNMRSQAELQAQFKRYEAIGHVLKTEAFLWADADFLAKIHQRIQQEPAYLLPQQKKVAKRGYQQLAMAASVAVVAIIGGRNLIDGEQHAQPSPSLQVAQQSPAKPAAPLQLAQQPPSKPAIDTNPAPLNKRINDYLQAHNNSVYNNGDTAQPYARVTTYSQK